MYHINYRKTFGVYFVPFMEYRGHIDRERAYDKSASSNMMLHLSYLYNTIFSPSSVSIRVLALLH